MKRADTKYKLMFLIPLVALVGCKKYEHKNVITGIGSIGNQKVLLLEDTETGKERFLDVTSCKSTYYYDYSQLDDTVVIKCGGLHDDSEKDYQRKQILLWHDYGVCYNMDSIYARRERAKFNKMKNDMTIEQNIR